MSDIPFSDILLIIGLVIIAVGIVSWIAEMIQRLIVETIQQLHEPCESEEEETE